VLALVGGYSAALFCYGQTGSGKTHTMFGAEGSLDGCLASAATLAAASRSGSGNGPSSSRGGGSGGGGGAFESGLGAGAGVAPRVLADVLASAASGASRKGPHAVDSTVSLSCVEVFNDTILDLLTGKNVRLFRVGEGEGADAWRDAQGGRHTQKRKKKKALFHY